MFQGTLTTILTILAAAICLGFAWKPTARLYRSMTSEAEPGRPPKDFAPDLLAAVLAYNLAMVFAALAVLSFHSGN